MSIPSECRSSKFSQTGCGFVVEFVDIIKQSKMMDTRTALEGWPNTVVRKYLNEDLFYKLPVDLQKVLNSTSETYVKTIYSCLDDYDSCASKSNNGKYFESYDKLFLFSAMEIKTYKPTDNYSRVTDYYSLKNSTKVKKFKGQSLRYWTRNPYRSGSFMDSSGSSAATVNWGVAPSFRIGFSESDITETPVCTSFSNDSWNVIRQNIINGYSSCYKLGDIKQVYISGYGYHNIKIVNKKRTIDCDNTVYSQTGCGFVFAFDDILAVDYMNDGRTNTGSWNNSKARSVLNNTIYNALPPDLKNVITKTHVLTGYGSNDSTYFESDDYLFLPSLGEIYVRLTTDDDNAKSKTRHLDYYKAKASNGIEGAVLITVDNMNSDNSMVNNPKKTYNSSNAWYWTRTPMPGTSDGFKMIDGEGYIEGNIANLNKYGLSPMFKVN